MKGKIKVGRVREPLPVRFVSGHRFTRRVAMRVAEAIKDYIPKVAVPVSPYRFAAQHVFFLFLSLPFALAAPFLAFLVHPAFLLLLLAPPAAFFAPWLRLKSMVGDRKRATDGELPFFAIHAAIAQSADFTPKNTAWVALNAFLATAAIWLVPAISEGVTGILGF